MKMPRFIRKDIVIPNINELQRYGSLRETPSNPGKKGGRPAEAYYLNEGQALRVCMFSRTEKATDVRQMVMETFMGSGHRPDYPCHRQSRFFRLTAFSLRSLENDPQSLHLQRPQHGTS
jgi:hypothetical protein